MTTKSSKLWLKEHFSDVYVKQAQQDGFRSRAAYKLLEIHNKNRLFKPGMLVLELGSAPGAWSQVIMKLIKPKGRLIAVDLLPMDPIEGVKFIQGDFTEEPILHVLSEELTNAPGIDWVLSDMAPNMSGNPCIDMPRAMYLAELALDFSISYLNTTGGCLIKVFQGEGFDSFIQTCRKHFASLAIKKPKASRSRSREVYILARYLKK